MREKFAEEEQLTFKPQISRISDKVANLKNQGVPVLERLAVTAEEL